ncbi:hypothetical protein [Globicatella sanguinis]|uniref:hypothetical protein n=1 Tax=Globicatella sanguinis TaxID=13076 RepID=UPI000824EB7A|nr:hypothetical protein [Globicatella sanguinis]
MGLFDWFKKKTSSEKSAEESLSTHTPDVNPVHKIVTPGLHLSTHKTTTTDPSIEDIQSALTMAVNAYDEYVLLEWIDDAKQKTYLYGVGFGTTYHIEYRPKNGQKGFAYVREGVPLEEAQQLYLAFKMSHQVTIDFQWQWLEVE